MSDETQEQEQKQDLIKAAKALPPTETFSLKPRTFEEAFRFANIIAESSLIPKEFHKSPANVLVAVQLGMELGVSPMQALQNMYVVNGRPTIFGDLVPALVYGSGLCELFQEDGDERKATCTVKRKGFAPITRTFSWEDAMRAKTVLWENGQKKTISLAEKDTYQNYPKRMLQMRARSWAVRDAFPDVLKGVGVYEEAQDEPESIEAVGHFLHTSDEKPIALPQPKEKADGGKERSASKVVDEVVPSPASDGVRAGGSDQGAAAGENAKGASARKGQAKDGKGVEKEKPKVGTMPNWPWENEQLPILERTELWIEHAPNKEIEDMTFLNAHWKEFEKADQIPILQKYNARQRKILELAKMIPKGREVGEEG